MFKQTVAYISLPFKQTTFLVFDWNGDRDHFTAVVFNLFWPMDYWI